MGKKERKLVANNKKAYHDYFIEETYEAGIVLTGTEIKSVRQGKVSIKESYARIKDGDELEIDVAAGKIANLTSGETIGFNPVPKFMMDMLSGGGLVEYVKRKVAQ